MSAYTAAKARRLLEAGAVCPEPSGNLQLVTVQGETGRYRVVVGPGFRSCTCEGWRKSMLPCSHIEAVVELVNASPEERKGWLRATAERVAADRAHGEALIDGLAT